MDSRKRQALKDHLRKTDPALEHPELEASRAEALKARILRQARQPEPTGQIPWPRLAMGFAAIATLAVILLWRPSPWSSFDRDAVQSANQEKASFQKLRETRLSELHFTTPGGTRIIWQFRNETPETDSQKTTS